MMHYGWDYGNGLWMFVGLALMIGLIVLVVWAVMRLSGPSHPPTRDGYRPTPNEILRERFARGEITEQEFEQAKKVLGPDR